MKKVLSFLLSITMLIGAVCSVNFSAFADEAELESISFTPATSYSFPENSDGEWYENDGEEFFLYTLPGWNEGDRLVLNYSDGTSVEYVNSHVDDMGFNFVSEDGYTAYPSMNDNQWDEHWQIDGENNYIIISYNDVEVNVPVSITENPVESIAYTPSKPVEYTENTDGFWSKRWDSESEEEFEYYQYYYYMNNGDVLTVNYKDGTSKDFTYREYFDDDERSALVAEDGEKIYSDEVRLFTGETNFAWTPDGENNYYSVKYYGATADVPVTIKKNNVKSIAYTPARAISYTECTEGYWGTRINPETEKRESFYYYYYRMQNGDALTVNFIDGKSKKYYFNPDVDDEILIASDGSSISRVDILFDDEQYDNPWVLNGKNNYFTVDYMGSSVKVPVAITESLVKSIKFVPIEKYVIYENTHGNWEDDYYEYDLPSYSSGDILIVTYKDKKIKTFVLNDDGEFASIDGTIIDSYDDVQRFSNQYDQPWTVGGSNYFELSYMGKTCSVPVSIVENPIQHIEFTPAKPIEFIKDVDGWGEEGEPFHYYGYDFNNGDILTVYDKDENAKDYVYTGFYEPKDRRGFVAEDGDFIDAYDIDYSDNQWNNPWVMGGDFNYFTLDYFGQTCDVPISIVENPVASIEITTVKPLNFVEHTHGWYNYKYDDTEQYWEYYYSFEKDDKLTVHYSDGRTVDYFYDDEFNKEYDDFCFVSKDGEHLTNIYCESKQNEEWGIGEYSFVVKYMGQTADIPFNVVETPVKSIAVTAVNNIVLADFPVEPKFDLTVNYKDGTVKQYKNVNSYSYDFGDIESAEIDVQYDDDDDSLLNIEYANCKTQARYSIVSDITVTDIQINQVKSLDDEKYIYELAEDNYLEATVTYSNGEVSKTTDFVIYAGGFENECSYIGAIYAKYPVYIKFSSKDLDYDDHMKMVAGDTLTYTFGEDITGNIIMKKFEEHTHKFGNTVTAPTCTEKGFTTYTCSICGYSYKDDFVDKIPHKYSSKTTPATKSANGKIVKTCSACGDTKTTIIYKPSSFKLSTITYTYNGKAKSPSITVKDSKGNTLKKDTDYTVSSPSGRKNVGKYTYKITLKGKYSGTATVSFKINPVKTSISKLSATKKGFKVAWSKKSTPVTGYQIQYSTSSKFSSAKTVTVSSYKTTSKTVSKLSAKKKYYVRVRTYKTVSGTKYYSSWSSAKSVTTKK